MCDSTCDVRRSVEEFKKIVQDTAKDMQLSEAALTKMTAYFNSVFDELLKTKCPRTNCELIKKKFEEDSIKAIQAQVTGSDRELVAKIVQAACSEYFKPKSTDCKGTVMKKSIDDYKKIIVDTARNMKASDALIAKLEQYFVSVFEELRKSGKPHESHEEKKKIMDDSISGAQALAPTEDKELIAKIITAAFVEIEKMRNKVA